MRGLAHMFRCAFGGGVKLLDGLFRAMNARRPAIASMTLGATAMARNMVATAGQKHRPNINPNTIKPTMTEALSYDARLVTALTQPPLAWSSRDQPKPNPQPAGGLQVPH
jgi:hypothetical protein